MVLCVLLPSVMLFVGRLHANAKRLMRSRSVKAKLGWLYNGYMPEARWWEVVVTWRKVALAGALAMGIQRAFVPSTPSWGGSRLQRGTPPCGTNGTGLHPSRLHTGRT